MKKTIAIILLALATSIIGYLYFQEKANSTRLFADLQASTSSATNITTRDGHQASKKQAQELTPAELRKAFPEVTNSLKNLYIKPRLVESYTQASQTLKAEITAPVHNNVDPDFNDSTDRVNPVRESIRTLDFADEWISIHAALGTDTGKITVAAVDTIFTAVYRGERRRPWLWILSRRNYEAAATNRSPYISIQVIQAGIIKK